MGCQRLRAQPQVLNGEPAWPEHWGLSRRQVQELLERLQRDPLWHPDNNVYTLVDDFVVPWTRGTGVGYALHANSTAPKEVNVMVSHAWGEHAEDFLRAVLRATTEGDVVYICALANYQAEDGHGPSIMEQIGSDPMESPFRRVLAHIHSCGVKAGCAWRYRPCLMRLHLVVLIVAMMFLCAPVLVWMLQHGLWQYDPRLEPERARIIVSWLPLSAGLCAVAGILHCWHQRCAQIYPGRMLVVPNRQSDIYSRLWCVYEIFVASCLGLHIDLAPTLAPAGATSTRDAVCRSEEDTKRIQVEIETTCRCGGYDKVDSAVRRLMRRVKWHTFGIWLKYIFLFVAPACVGPKQHLDLGIIYVVTCSIVIAGLAGLACYSSGVFPADGLAFAASLAAVVVHGVLISAKDKAMWVFQIGQIAILDTASFGVVFLAANCRPFPRCFTPGGRLPMIFAMLLLRLVSVIGLRRLDGLPLIPEFFVDACISDITLVFPVYMCWTESLHFGMKFCCPPRWPCLTSAVAWLAVIAWAAAFLSLDRWLEHLPL